MRTPERIPAAASCSRVCGACPMAERCHPKAIISSNIVSFPFYKLRKENPGEALVPTQLRPSFSGGPVPEVMAVKCNKCKDGSCSEHQKAA